MVEETEEEKMMIKQDALEFAFVRKDIYSLPIIIYFPDNKKYIHHNIEC